jgi:hypothetical protein
MEDFSFESYVDSLQGKTLDDSHIKALHILSIKNQEKKKSVDVNEVTEANISSVSIDNLIDESNDSVKPENAGLFTAMTDKDFIFSAQQSELNEENENSEENQECEENEDLDENNTEKGIESWSPDRSATYAKFVEEIVIKRKVINKYELRELFLKKFKNDLTEMDKSKVNPKSSQLVWQKKLTSTTYNRLCKKNKIIFDDPLYASADFILKHATAIKKD